MGDGIKKVEKNEFKTIIVQRRSIRASKDLKKGQILKKKDLVFLRPCSKNGMPPYEYKKLLGKKLKKNLKIHDELSLNYF